jgi:hypothetical protein
MAETPTGCWDAQQVMSAGPPDELLWTSFARRRRRCLIPACTRGRPGIMSVIEWSGDPVEGRELLTRLRDELGPLASDLARVPLRTIQTEGDEVFGPGLLSYVKATFADTLSPELIDVIAGQGRQLGSEVSQIEVLSMGGAIRQVAPQATAFPHRNASWLINDPGELADRGAERGGDRMGPRHVRGAAAAVRGGACELHGPGRTRGRRGIRCAQSSGCGRSRPSTTRQRVRLNQKRHPPDAA